MHKNTLRMHSAVSVYFYVHFMPNPADFYSNKKTAGIVIMERTVEIAKISEA